MHRCPFWVNVGLSCATSEAILSECPREFHPCCDLARVSEKSERGLVSSRLSVLALLECRLKIFTLGVVFVPPLYSRLARTLVSKPYCAACFPQAPLQTYSDLLTKRLQADREMRDAVGVALPSPGNHKRAADASSSGDEVAPPVNQATQRKTQGHGRPSSAGSKQVSSFPFPPTFDAYI
jgi:hypothetical protein